MYPDNPNNFSDVSIGNNTYIHSTDNIDHNTNAPWIFVTGASGYIGSHLCACLKQTTGYNVMQIDLRAKLLKHTTNYCDLYADEDFAGDIVMQAIRDYKPHCIIHLAASSTIGPGIKNPLEYWDNNVEKTLLLLRACVNHGVKNVIFASTSAVYADIDEPVNESALIKPPNAYSKTKHAIELALEDCYNAYGLNSVCFRFFNAAGSHNLFDLGELKGSSHLIAKIIESAVHKTSFSVFGTDYPTADGTAIRDYIHVMDVVDALVKGITWLPENPGHHIFNLGSSKGYSVQEIINTTEQLLNIELSYRYADRRDGDSAKRFADITKAQNILEWTPKRNINDIIQSSYKWYNSSVYKNLVANGILADY